MYVEKNGYVIMNSEKMEFLEKGFESLSDTTGDIDDACVYEDIAYAVSDCKDLNDAESDVFEIIRYEKTIWIDRMYQKNIKETFNIGCNCCNCEGEEKND